MGRRIINYILICLGLFLVVMAVVTSCPSPLLDAIKGDVFGPKIDVHAIGWIGGASVGWKTGDAPLTGSDYQSFYSPGGVYVDNSGNIYIADYKNRISKWED